MTETGRGRGKKQNYDKNFQAHEAWEKRKRVERPKQVWVPVRFVEQTGEPVGGYWEKVSQ